MVTALFHLTKLQVLRLRERIRLCESPHFAQDDKMGGDHIVRTTRNLA